VNASSLYLRKICVVLLICTKVGSKLRLTLGFFRNDVIYMQQISAESNVDVEHVKINSLGAS
jgi:hypothetical protein